MSHPAQPPGGRGRVAPVASMPPPLVDELWISDFRTMRELTLSPGPVCALVGDAQAGKSNLLAAIHAVLDPPAANLGTLCRAAGVPFVALYDRDARPGQHPSGPHRTLNARLRGLAGDHHAIEMAPDFEWISHLPRGSHKPERAWRRFAELPVDRMPGELVRAAKLALDLARPKRRL